MVGYGFRQSAVIKQPITNQDLTREQVVQRMDELAREYAETHDPEVKRELERLSWELGRLSTH